MNEETPPDQAAAKLGVGADADAAQVRAAFRRTVAAGHPDHGGDLADVAEIVAARDALLSTAGRSAATRSTRTRSSPRARRFVKRRRFGWR